MRFFKISPLISILILFTGAFPLSSAAETRVADGYAQSGALVNLYADKLPKLKYPRKAQRLGVEGYVEVGCDVAADGTKSDIRVLDAEPRRIFDKAAIEFVEALQINPPLLDGNEVSVRDVKLRVIFRLN
ncbi:MAG: energy transducer TonB [Pseudomonadales bacterium]